MKDLTVGKPGSLILKFATPMLLGNLFQQLYQIVDSIIVGNYLGKEALAAVGESFPIIFSLISFTIGIATGGTIIISQYFGAKDNESVLKTIDTLYIFIFCASVVITAVGLIFSDDIFRMIEIPEDVLPQAKQYFNIFILGTIFFFGFNGTSAILRGLGDSTTPLYFMIISTIVNLILDLLFIIVFKWGVEGAAFATIISQGGAFIAAILYLNKTHQLINFNPLKLKFNTKIFRQSIRIGLPSGLQQTFVSLGMVALLSFVNKYGTNVATAYSVAGRIDNLAILPAMYFGQALSAFTGQNLGANLPKRVRSGLIATLCMSVLVSALISAIVLIFRNELMDIFLKEDDSHVIDIGAKYLVIVASGYVIFSIMFTFNGVLRGAGDTIIPMFITLLSLWVIRVPFAYLLSKEYDETGIWWSVPIAWLVGSVLSSLYYSTGKWKRKGVIKYTD